MTATTPLTVAIRKADDTYPRFDRHRDRNQLRRTVIELNTRGFTAKQISHYVGLNEQQIRHIICGHKACMAKYWSIFRRFAPGTSATTTMRS